MSTAEVGAVATIQSMLIERVAGGQGYATSRTSHLKKQIFQPLVALVLILTLIMPLFILMMMMMVMMRMKMGTRASNGREICFC